ncbi:hypothetical protein [Actinobacillus vicugnae]|nr:hypothetical protein [Actinobacillus vicugnae]
MRQRRLKSKKKLACNNKSRRILQILKRKRRIAARHSLAFMMLQNEV